MKGQAAKGVHDIVRSIVSSLRDKNKQQKAIEAPCGFGGTADFLNTTRY